MKHYVCSTEIAIASDENSFLLNNYENVIMDSILNEWNFFKIWALKSSHNKDKYDNKLNITNSKSDNFEFEKFNDTLIYDYVIFLEEHWIEYMMENWFISDEFLLIHKKELDRLIDSWRYDTKKVSYDFTYIFTKWLRFYIIDCIISKFCKEFNGIFK